MNNKQFIGLAVVVLLAAALIGLVAGLVGRQPVTTVQAQTTPEASWNGQGGISVRGVGTILVKPDIVQATVGVETRGTTVSAAQKLAADKSQQITDALIKAGIKTEDIKTSGYNLYPNYAHQDGQVPRLVDYVVNNRLDIVIRDISKAGEVLDAAGNAGATEISGINFTLENNSDALNKARVAAMNDARQRAEQLAGAGKVGAGTVLKINESYQNVNPQPAIMPAAASGPMYAGSTVIQSGEFKVMVDVEVTYAIK